jgi:hypothetical protein
MISPRISASKLLMVMLLLCTHQGSAQERSTQVPLKATANRHINSSESELSKARAGVIEKIKETRAGAEKLLALHEAERQRRAADYERRRDLYNQGLIARNEVIQGENNLIEAMRRVVEDKRWISETDMAVTEAALRDELLRSPELKTGGYSETTTLLRFNGASLWTLNQASKIESFFAERFGRALPISALGQTATHDRLHFDHRNAMDVALQPDSKEGQALLSYLRQNGIPFIAFRSAVPGAATGAHIHIGKPSARF